MNYPVALLTKTSDLYTSVAPATNNKIGATQTSFSMGAEDL